MPQSLRKQKGKGASKALKQLNTKMPKSKSGKVAQYGSGTGSGKKSTRAKSPPSSAPVAGKGMEGTSGRRPKRLEGDLRKKRKRSH